MKKEDVEYLNNYCVSNTNDKDYDPQSLHIFLTNQKVYDHNKMVLDLMRKDGKSVVKIKAKDKITTLNVDDYTKICLLKTAMTKSPAQTQN